MTDVWARYPLDEMLAQKIAAEDRADPNMAVPRPKIEFVGRAASEPTINYLSSEQIRPEAAGTVRVRGIDVPLRPNPPGAEDCCMSGCVNCVYNLYADDVEEWKEEMSAIRARLADASPPITTEEWNPKKLGPLPGESSAEVKEEEAEEEAAVGTEDPTLQAFFQLEQRITRKHRNAAKAAERSSEL